MKKNDHLSKRDLKAATMVANIIGTRAAVSSPRPRSIPSYAFRGSTTAIIRPVGRDEDEQVVETYAAKKVPIKYTGTACIGISVLHKSNAVPVFSSDQIIDIARMRR